MATPIDPSMLDYLAQIKAKESQDAALEADRQNMLREQLAAHQDSIPSSIDWTPLAAQLDSLYGGNSVSAAAKSNLEQNKASQAEIDKLSGQITKAGPKPKNLALDAAKLNYLENAKGSRQEKSQQFNKGLHDETLGNTISQQDEAKTQKLATVAAGATEPADSFKELEKNIGMSVEQAAATPEFQIPGTIGRGFYKINFLTESGRKAKAAMTAILNAKLKDRSGAAVTVPEFDRLKTEFEGGSFNTDAELMNGMARAKRIIADHQAQLEAGFDEGTKSQFKKQGGKLSSDLITVNAATPSADIDSDPEVQAALAAQQAAQAKLDAKKKGK